MNFVLRLYLPQCTTSTWVKAYLLGDGESGKSLGLEVGQDGRHPIGLLQNNFVLCDLHSPVSQVALSKPEPLKVVRALICAHCRS